jgi:FkbM family methyltransferase
MTSILELYDDLLNRHRTGARFIDEIFYSQVYGESKPKFTVIDIGAFEGEFSFYCLPFADDIYAIEPDPKPFAVMNSLISKHQLESSIRTFPIAISDKNGGRQLHASGAGGSALLEEGRSSDVSVRVDTMTLNQFMLEEEIEHVDILKIDVEGQEYAIFDSPDFTEAAPKIDLIIGEVHGGMDDIYKSLGGCGLKVEPLPGSVFIARREK